jgi:bacterioferritin-associated ferredoxin
MCKKTIRERVLEQIDLVEELQSVAGINIVNCGNCGSVLLHKIIPLTMDTPLEDYDITCPYCDFQSEPCDFPDFLYRGMEHSLIMDIVLASLRKNDTLSIDQAKSVEDAINNGYIDTCDIFEDFVGYVSENATIDHDTLMDYQEHYQNLLSHKENLKIIKESFGN